MQLRRLGKQVLQVFEMVFKIIISIVFAGVFLFITSFTAVAGQFIYLWVSSGGKVTNAAIDAGLPNAFLLSFTVWLILLVLYRKYFW